MATNAFGQGIAVTPLQMLNAVSTIGNDGMMMKPTLIKAIVRPDGVQTIEPQQVRQVISPQAAQTLRGMMVQVMEQPANQANQVPGIRVADKTGTADLPTDGGYTSGKTYASVVALIPADHPRLAILIRLDAPAAIYGGTVASPILKRIGTELAAYYRIPASGTGQ
jgi:cell division protein FtsI/penicillin-binding protein 2